MKVGIITINDTNPNYGNRLQNYAVHRIMLKQGVEPTTLYVEDELPISLKQNIKYMIHKTTKFTRCKNAVYWKNIYPKLIKFKKFNSKYIPTRRINTLDEISDQYEYFAIGSDQVWNPTWYKHCLIKKDAYLLTFANQDQKICMSPSFGISELPKEWEDHFRKSLKLFDNISVREEAGAEIVKNLTGKEAEVLIDPTLMLDKNEWIKIQNKPQAIDTEKEYILTYFIAEKSDETLNYIKWLESKYNLKVYNLLDYTQPDLYLADPSEFIYLINKAKLVLTDSFHACIFSFIFAKPFQVFTRNGAGNNMMSRIETLLRKFDLERKLYVNKFENDIFECDYYNGYNKLAQEQLKVREFISKSLKKI